MDTTNACACRTDDERLRLRGRVLEEFLELPGLVVTRAQFRRLFSLEPDICDAVLTDLVDGGVLVHDGDQYRRVH